MNNQLTVTLYNVTENKDAEEGDEKMITTHLVSVSIPPAQYANIGSLTTVIYEVFMTKIDELGIDGWVGINSDNLSQKVRITTNDPGTVLVDMTTPLAKFLGFKTAHVPSAYVEADDSLSPSTLRSFIKNMFFEMSAMLYLYNREGKH